MADIIDSRKADPALLINEFRTIVRSINMKWEESIISPLTITLGDEFQGIIQNMETCYKLIFDIEEFIIANSLDIKLRYLVNYGKIDTPINKHIAYEMLGDGLTYAREQLNKLKSSTHRFKIFSDKDQQTTAIINDLFLLYAGYVDSWKLSEYPIISEFLKDRDYKVVANKLNMNKSSTWRRHKNLYIQEYNTTKELILTLNKIL